MPLTIRGDALPCKELGVSGGSFCLLETRHAVDAGKGGGSAEGVNQQGHEHAHDHAEKHFQACVTQEFRKFLLGEPVFFEELLDHLVE